MEKNDMIFGHETVKYVNSIGTEGLQTGAYNDSIASNYNRLPRLAVVLLKRADPEISEERESLNETKPNSWVTK